MKWNMHELHAALTSAENIHVDELDGTLLSKSLFNNTLDYSLQNVWRPENPDFLVLEPFFCLNYSLPKLLNN